MSYIGPQTPYKMSHKFLIFYLLLQKVRGAVKKIDFEQASNIFKKGL